MQPTTTIVGEARMQTISQAAAALRGRKVSAVELATEALRSARRTQPSLCAFITITEELALEQARRADADFSRGVDRGPLQGIPIVLKDVFATAGIRTTCGSKLLEQHVPEHDATVVHKLASAGAVLVGKTNMHELAYGITSSNPHFGFVRNPRDTDRIPGGSSGGSGAAVAAGVVFMGMGSDTGGSIRIPASFCGVVGLKPTFGRVSRHGVLPLDFSLDHMGPLTRSVRDAAIVLEAIAGEDALDDTSSREPAGKYVPAPNTGLQGVRVGLPTNFYFDQADEEVVRAVHRAAEVARSAGAHVTPVHVPDVAAMNTVGRIILLSEASALLEPHLHRTDQFGADVLTLLQQGRCLLASDYINAQRLRRVMKRDFAQVFEQVDCLLTPCTPTAAPKIGQSTVTLRGVEEDVRLASTRLVRGINVLGLPALAMPCGVNSENLPLGLQIIARPFEEALLLRAGAAIEDGLAAVL
jgi:aspartyl-tRNA(Asn)/glutamyl-tRNA(Gln) amidotransferase subunit A